MAFCAGFCAEFAFREDECAVLPVLLVCIFILI